VAAAVASSWGELRALVEARRPDPAVAEAPAAQADGVMLGLGRIVALYHRSSALYQIH
jgi:hypothetical protein